MVDRSGLTPVPYPQLAEALPSVQRIVSAYINDPKRHELELEMRFGALVDGRFVAGLDRGFVETALGRMATNADCKSGEWVEHHDVYFKPPAAVLAHYADCKTLRTRVQPNLYTLALENETISKRRVMEAVIGTSDARHAIRLVLSREERVPEELLPHATDSVHVRIQTRKRVTWTREPKAPAAWAYDFSMTWGGQSRSAAEEQKLSAPPVHEFEIELLDSPYLLSRGESYIATSFLLKALDFIDPQTTLFVQRETSFCE